MNNQPGMTYDLVELRRNVLGRVLPAKQIFCIIEKQDKFYLVCLIFEVW